jgi:ATP-dependent DNA ligase
VYGAYLLAVYNEEEEQYQTISKIGTGFTEVMLAELSESLKPAIIPAPKPYYRWPKPLSSKSEWLCNLPWHPCFKTTCNTDTIPTRVAKSART